MGDQLTAEQLLLSALINSQDVKSAATYGMTPEYFAGFRSEYVWLLNYVDNYDTQPSREVFLAAFPDFRLGSHEDVRSAVDMVFRAYGRRAMVKAMTEAYTALDLDDVEIAWATLQAAEPRRTQSKPRKLLTDLGFLDRWDEARIAIEIPYPTIQRHTGGLEAGNLWYWAARPGAGKSAHLVNIAAHSVLAGNRVRCFSLEMSEAEVRGRFHALLARKYGYPHITLNDIRSRRVDKHDYKTFVGELEDRLRNSGGELTIHTPANGPVTPGVIAAGANEWDLNVIDYVGLVKIDGGGASVDDWRLAAKVSNSLKETALGQSTAILAAAQINRDGDHGNAPPKLRNLAQSDALGQDADVLITGRAHPHNVGSHLSIEKNRHGPSGAQVHTLFDPNVGDFKEVTEDAINSLILDKEAGL